MERPNDDRPDDGLRYVFVDRPRCPSCNCAELSAAIRSKRDGDATIQRRECLDCSHRFWLVWE